MFVDIKSLKLITAENLLTPHVKGKMKNGVRQPKVPINPFVCLNMLQCTNFKRHIRAMLQCIAELPETEQVQFKDVVLACVDRREQPDDILQMVQNLAKTSHYENELLEAQKIKEGEFLLSSSNLVRGLVSSKGHFFENDLSSYGKLICLNEREVQFWKDVKFPEVIDVSRCSEVMFEWCDFNGVSSVLFKDGARALLFEGKNLPKNLDVSMCADVEIYNCNLDGWTALPLKEGATIRLNRTQNLPANLDVSKSPEVSLSGCDLANQPNLRFKDGAMINLSQAYHLPKNLDVSMCDRVEMCHCDLSELPNIRFKDGAKVSLWKATNLPENLDVSMCAEINLVGCDLANLSHLRFKDGAQVFMSYAKNLPHNIDVSPCSWLDWRNCDLKDQADLVFRSGAHVVLRETKNLHGKLDLSMCDFVQFDDCDMFGVERLILKNKKQKYQSRLFDAKNWRGELFLADDKVRMFSLRINDEFKSFASKIFDRDR